MLNQWGVILGLVGSLSHLMMADPITVGIASQYDFCLMLPPQPGQNVGDTEGSSLSRCMGTVPGSDAVGPMPEGKSKFKFLER